MAQISALTGREYHLFNYTGGGGRRTGDYRDGIGLRYRSGSGGYAERGGEKVGLLSVHLFRPFSLAHFFAQLPKTVQRIAVLTAPKSPALRLNRCAWM